MAGNDFGGHIRFRLADGRTPVLRGALDLGTSRYSVEPIANHDGSISRQATPRPRTAGITLEDTGIDPDDLINMPRQDVYFVEEFTGVTHIFLNAFFSGEPSIDRTTGEITGLIINGDGYQRLNG